MTLTHALQLLLLAAVASASSSVFPEERSDLQQYQDASKCFPHVGKVYMIYRNFYSDPLFGGSSMCVTLQRHGSYENFSTPITFSYGKNGSTSGKVELTSSPCYEGKNQADFQPDDDTFVEQSFSVIFTDCRCYVGRHLYVQNGHGCSLWRTKDTVHDTTDYCDFIYAENCGTSPMYPIYDSSCQ